jgi:hypothetical protein
MLYTRAKDRRHATLFMIDALMFSAAGVAAAVVANGLRTARLRAEKDAAAALAEAGIEAEGDLLGTYVARLPPTDLAIQNGVRRARPGSQAKEEEVCFVQIDLPHLARTVWR